MQRFQSSLGSGFQLGLGVLVVLGSGVAKAVGQVVPDQTLGIEGSQVRSLSPLDLRIEGGAMRGVNLFHSFRDFNVVEGQRVYFANPVGIETILGRVTGQGLSNIQGTLGVDGAASLFLLNPHGFVFGPNARLDIRGSFLASGGDRFSFPDGQEFSAVNPQVAPLLRVNVTPGLQLGSGQAYTGAIAAQGNLSVGGDLTLVGQSVSARDAIASATQLKAGGQLTIQGDQSVDLSLLSHPDSGLVSGGDMVLRSDSPVIGDAQYFSGGNFRVEGLNGQPGRLISPNDPVFRVAGDFTLADYTGASLHVLAGGSVTIPSVTITGVGMPASSLIEAVPLSRSLPDGTTVVQVNGVARPTLDVRAGTTAFGTPSQGSGAATSANIAIDQITVNQPNGLVLLTNQYQPNALPGAITVKTIDTRSPGGSGSVVLDSRGDIAVQTYGLIRTNGQSSGATGGTAGDVGLLANGAVTLGERAVIQARGYGSGTGGDITVLANLLTLNNRTQLESSSYGSGRGGDVAIALQGDLTMRGTNTRIASLVEVGGTGQGGNIWVNASNLTIGNGAGIFAGVRGQGAGGNITVDVPGTVAIDGTGGGSNSAIMNTLYAGAEGTSGDIVVRAGALRLTDGGVITTEAGEVSLGQVGNINAVTQGEALISGLPVDKTLPDIGNQAPVGSGKVDVFFLADNTGSMGGTITTVQRNSSAILSAVKGGDSRFSAIDVGLGVGSYVDDPYRGLNSPDYSYQIEQTITTDQQLAKVAIDQWAADNRGCNLCNPYWPEGNFFALQQVATSGQPTLSGFGTGFQTGWRDSAERVIIWFGDAYSVEETIDQAETINALQTNQVKVIAINTASARNGIDEYGQASAIAAATGGAIRNRIDTSGVTELILSVLGAVLSPDTLSITTNNCSPKCTRSSGLNSGALGDGVSPVATGGNIQLQAQTLNLDQSGSIQSLVTGKGQTGDIQVTAPNITINRLSGINSTGIGTETKTGNITVNANELNIQGVSSIGTTLYGVGTSGNVNINAGQINLQQLGAIATTSFGVTQSGNLSITADDIRMTDLSFIQTATSGASQSGQLTIDAKNLSLGNFSGISTTSGTADDFVDAIATFQGALNAGLDPQSAAFFLGALQSIANLNAGVSQGTTQGNSATLRINIAQDVNLQASAIGTKGLGQANGGDLLLQAGNLNLANDSIISSRSEGTGIAGSVNLAARDRLLLNNSEISASAAQSDGGNITLSANRILLRNGSLVSTSVFDSIGGGGNITINSRSFVAIEDSDILANAERGPGGDIFINSPAFLASLFSSAKATPVGRNPGSFDRFRGNGRVDISADSASGQSGTVNYPNVDPARGLNQLPVVFSDRSRIRNLCKAEGNRPGRAYRDKFIITGRGGMAETPFDTVRSLPSDPPAWIQPPSTPTQPASAHPPAHPTRPTLTEATTLHQTSDGRIHLIAAQPIPTLIQRPCTQPTPEPSAKLNISTTHGYPRKAI